MRISKSLVRVGLAAAAIGYCAHAAIAEDLATDAEKSYLALRKSTDSSRKLLADRWYALVQLQDWVDVTGKFTTKAKYVDHDPQLAWVKLRVIKGTGKDHVVKDLTIPLEKLDKTGQSRVRQISVLKEKVAAAIVADEEAKKKVRDKDGSGREMTEPAAAPAESRETEVPGRMLGEYPPAEQATSTTDTSTSGGLPAALPPLPNDAAAPTNLPATSSEPSAAPIPTAEGDRDGRPGPLPPVRGAVNQVEQGAEAAAGVPPLAAIDPNQPHMPDLDPWRMSYEAFQSDFERDPQGAISTKHRWPGVVRLQELSPKASSAAESADEAPNIYTAVPELAEVGDFVWEAVLRSDPTRDGNWAEALALAPLPEPIKLDLRLDDRGRSGTWQRFHAGDHVRFVGRFVGYQGQYIWVAAIHLFDEAVPAPQAATSDDRR